MTECVGLAVLSKHPELGFLTPLGVFCFSGPEGSQEREKETAWLFLNPHHCLPATVLFIIHYQKCFSPGIIFSGQPRDG